MIAIITCGMLMMTFPGKVDYAFKSLGITELRPVTILKEIAIIRLPLHVPKPLATSHTKVKVDSSRTEEECTCLL
ncbi:hypothetical protein [Echinicola strongylocentroti]|nr:hypothetical protein [Echinicola strongylocentroti]